MTSSASVTSQVCHFTSKWAKIYFFVQGARHRLHSRDKKLETVLRYKKPLSDTARQNCCKNLQYLTSKYVKKSMKKWRYYMTPPPPFSMLRHNFFVSKRHTCFTFQHWKWGRGFITCYAFIRTGKTRQLFFVKRYHHKKFWQPILSRSVWNADILNIPSVLRKSI